VTDVSAQKEKTDLALTIPQLIQGLKKADKGCLKIESESVTWFFYIDQGALLYITHSIDPIDRLDCHLRGLSRRIPSLTSDLRTQIRLSLDLPATSSFALQPDYQGIGMLLEQKILSADVAQSLLQNMSQEALELLLLVENHTTTFVPYFTASTTSLQPLEFETLLHDCQDRLQAWKSLAPHVASPYQRPYLFSQSKTTLSVERQQRLGALLKGYSFRHLALLIDQDELRLVKSLYPLILDKTVILRDPEPPYHELPNFSKPSVQTDGAVELAPIAPLARSETGSFGHFDSISQAAPSTKTYRVACIDDSPAMLQTIEQFLGKENIQLFLIQDSVKALIELMRIKPDLVLLDVGMPRVDGYELCRLLRKHPLFKKIPIIMVTGNTGLIDRARAKMSGTTDYMTKPFTQSDLLKMVFRHLE
jgi:two-component system, chemotaxis family, response regulator PixG